MEGLVLISIQDMISHLLHPKNADGTCNSSFDDAKEGLYEEVRALKEDVFMLRRGNFGTPTRWH